ncbi:MAG: pyridoxal-phosphate dependent enzyme [Gemmatimonadaceae bacterium]
MIGTASVATKKKIRHYCTDCGAEFPHGFTPRCPLCRGMVEVEYDLARAKIRESDRPLERYFDLLPIREREHLLSVGEGNTPCPHAGALGEALGLDNVYLKIESTNPTGTTKDRMATTVLSMLHELGLHEFITSSTGNSSNALAHAIHMHPFFCMHLFMGGAFRSRFHYEGAGIVVHALEGKDFTEAFNHARDLAHSRGLPFEGGFFNVARREGLKMAYFEAVDQIPGEIDWYFQASSSAMGVNGTAKGARELQTMGRIRRVPRMVCVQQESCAPLVNGFEEGSPTLLPHHIVERPTGIAHAILRGNPSGCYPYVYRMLLETNGLAVRVSEGEILAAQQQVLELEGVTCCTDAATTVAALRKLAANGTVGRKEVVMLNLTG